MPRRKAIVSSERTSEPKREEPEREEPQQAAQGAPENKAPSLIEAEVAALRDVVSELRERVVSLEGAPKAPAAEDRLAMVVFSGSLDRQIAALVLATGAAASGMQVDMFFTFWGLAALRDPKKRAQQDGSSSRDEASTFSRLFSRFLPRGFAELPLSRLNLGGLGPALVRRTMKDKRVASPEEMLRICAELGVRIWVCDMSRDLLGISIDELVDYPHLDHCGVAHFLGQASGGKVSLFV